MVFWLKRDGKQPTRAGIMHNRKVTPTEVKATGLGFQDDGLALSYNWIDQGAAYNFNPGFVPPDQAWTFFAVAVSPTDAVMYMGTADGLVSDTNELYHAAHNFSGTTLELGWDNYQPTRVFRGVMDEFAMFDKTLTPEEIATLFNAALPAILSITRTADPVYEGDDVTFQTTVAGPAPITYQWRKDGALLAGNTGTTFTLNSVTLADSGDYTVEAVTGGKALTSPVSHLEVLTSPPVLTEVPASGVRFLNGTMRFNVAARGSLPITFGWKHGTEFIPGATSPTLVLTDLQPADAGEYTAVVSNQYGTQEASATVTLVTPSKLGAAVASMGPVGYWRLDETSGTTAYDYWGGRDGVAYPGVTVGVDGPRPATFSGFEASNTAYEFNNSTRVNIPALNMNTASATFVAWIKPTGTPDDYDGIVFSRGGNTVAGLDFQTGGQLGYHWNDTGSTYNWPSALYPLADQWNFVALVVTPADGTIYLDDGSGWGLQYAVNYVAHAAEEFNGTLRLGADSDTTRFFRGTIDDVVIFDRALTEAEITALRDAGTKGTVVTTPVQIVQQPKGQAVLVGSSYTLSAKASGSPPLLYQWKKNGQDLPGAIRSSLAFENATESDTGTYQLFVTQGTTVVSTTPVTFTVKPVPTHINVPENLVLHLKFDGDYKDSSGRNNNGSPEGLPQIVAGQVGTGALRYSTAVSDGTVTSANYVTLGAPSDLDIGAGVSFTAAFWIKFTGAPGDLQFFGNTINSYGDAGIDFAPSYNQGGWSWYISPADSGMWAGIGVYDPVQQTINDGEWHHLVHIFDRTDLATTYLDGVKVHTLSIASAADWAFNTFGATWNIGQGVGGMYPEAGTFEMDDLGFWRRALTEYEAQGIYIVGKTHGRSFDSIAPPEVELTVTRAGSNVTIQWSAGTLESAVQIGDTWTPVSGAAPPSYMTALGPGPKFYRAKVSD